MIFYKLDTDFEKNCVEYDPSFEWKLGPAKDWNGIVCPKYAGHSMKGRRITELRLKLISLRIVDFSNPACDFVVTERVVQVLSEAGVTGYEVRPAHIVSSKRKIDRQHWPRLWELVVTGGGGNAHSDSGIEVIDTCESCGAKSYSSYRNGIIIDEAQWDGSDFFGVNEWPQHVLVTERVKALVEAHRLTNCLLIPSHEMRWPETVERPEDYLAKRRAWAARDVASLLADLESADTATWMNAAVALGEKRAPVAVDALLKRFSHPHPIIPQSAASAVAAIAGHAETPEEIRSEVLSKLIGLLNHGDRHVRGKAVYTLGLIGDQRAGPEMMRLLRDPEESVRGSALFAIGLMAYKPALEMVERLTKDRSRSVRERARDVVKDLTKDSP